MSTLIRTGILDHLRPLYILYAAYASADCRIRGIRMHVVF